MSPKRDRKLVEFSDSYHKYPKNLGIGYYARYPTDHGLEPFEVESRSSWISDAHRWANHPMTLELIDALEHNSINLLEVVKSSVFSYGLFFRKFAERSIVRSLRALVEPDPAIRVTDWNRYSNVQGLKGTDIEIVSDMLVDIGFVRADEDGTLSRETSDWFTNNSNKRSCTQCGSEFRTIDLPYWVYYGSNGTQGLCFRCPLENPLKASISKYVADFVHTAGFVPRSNSSPIEPTFMSRIEPDNRLAMISAWCQMGGIEWVSSKYPSWFHAVESSGVLPEDVLRTGRGLKCLATDDHECLSLEEQQIDNWLSDNQIYHEKEPRYPVHPTLNSTGRKRADWKCGDIFVEYFGLVGDPNYDSRTADKFEMCRNLGIEMIGVYPEDLSDLESKFGSFLNT